MSSYLTRRWIKRFFQAAVRSRESSARVRRGELPRPSLEHLETRIVPAPVQVAPGKIQGLITGTEAFSSLSGTYEIVGTLRITSGSTLDIGTGVNVLIDQGVQVFVDGTLNVQGGTSGGATITVQNNSAAVVDAITVDPSGAMNVTSASFNLATPKSADTSAIVVSPGSVFNSSGATYNWSQFSYDPRTTAATNQTSGNTFASTVFTRVADVPFLGGNKSFVDIDFFPGDQVPAGQDIKLGLIGSGGAANLTYVFQPGTFVINPASTLEIGLGVNALVEEGATIADDGTLQVDSGATVAIQDANNGVASGIQVNGTLSADNVAFTLAGSANGSDISQIQVNQGASFVATGSTFNWNQLNFGIGYAIGPKDLQGNAFINTTISLPVADVPNLSDNLSFGNVDLLPDDMISAGETIDLAPIGQVTTASLRYVVAGPLTIDQNGELDVTGGAILEIDEGQTISDEGVMKVTASAVETVNGDNGLTSGIVVQGSLVANQATFLQTGVGGSNSDTTSLEIGADGSLTASSSTFGWDQLEFDSSTPIAAGSLSGNAFDTSVLVPLVDVPGLANNQSYQRIVINANDGVPSGEDVTLPLMGNSNTINYVLGGAFTVQPGGTLEVASGVELTLLAGFTLTVDGTMKVDAGATVQFQKTSEGVQTTLVVDGVLSTTGATFDDSSTTGTDKTILDVAPGGLLKATGTTILLDRVEYDPGSLLGLGDLTGNTIDTPLSLPIADLPLLGNNVSFTEIDFLPGDSVPDGSTVTLTPLGNGSTIGPLYVFPESFTVQAGGTLVIGVGTSTAIPEGVVLTVDGTLFVDPHSSVVLEDLKNQELTGISVAGTLNANGATFTRGPLGNGTDTSFIEVTGTGQINSTASTVDIDQLNLDAGSTDTLTGNVFDAQLTINSGINSASSLTLNDFSQSGATVVAAGPVGTNINLVDNYWATSSDTTIEAKITDGRVAGKSLPIVNFDPVETVPPTQTSVISTTAPFSLSSQHVTLKADVFTTAGSINQGTVQFLVFDSNDNQIGSTVTSLTVNNDVASAVFTLPGDTVPGQYTIHATYNGGSGFLTSQDFSQTLTVLPAVTTTVALNETTTFSYNQQTLSLSATVTSAAGTVAEGSVSFAVFNSTTGAQVGTSVSGSVNQSGTANAMYTLPPATGAGAYKIVASYTGDQNFAPSSDSLRLLTISKASTTTTVSGTPVVFNYSAQPVAVSADVTTASGGANEGTVTFTLESPFGAFISSTTANVQGGTASADVSLSAHDSPGSYIVLASYSGGPNLLSSSSPSGTETVQSATTSTQTSNVSTAFSASPHNINLSATVTSPAGTVIEGLVTFSIFGPNNTLIGSVMSGSPQAGQGTVTVSFPLPGGLAPGSYSIDAAFSGDVNLQTSSDTTHTLTIGAAQSSITAASATTSFSESAQFVTVSATLTSPGGTVNQGSVTFTVLDGGGHTIAVGAGAATGSGPVSTTLVLPAGVAPGTYTIDAVYGGGTDFAGNSDNSHTLTVTKAATTSTASGLSVSFSDNAQTLALSTALFSQAGAVSGGTVTFTVRNGTGQQVGTAVTSNTVDASFVLPAGTPAGSYTIDAAYSGTTDFLSSTDVTGALTVSQTPTATAASAASSTYSLSSPQVTLHATVSSTNGPVNEGTVLFTVLNGSTVIGVPVSGSVVGGAASATFSVPSGTAPGTYTLLAQYSDSPANFTASDDTQAPATFTVGLAPTTTAVTTADVSASGSQPVNLVATVSSPDGQVNQGTVSFSVFSGATQIGITVTSGTVGAGSAKATFTIPAGTPAGTYTVEATYSGGAIFQPSAPGTGTLLIDLPPVLPAINSGNPIAMTHDQFPYIASLGASSPLGNPLSYTATVVGDSVPFDLEQQYQFQGMGYSTLGATAYVLSSNTVNRFGNTVYLIRPSDGGLFPYDGSGSYSHTFANVTPLATLGSNVYTDPTILLNAQSPVDYTAVYNLQQQYQFTGVGYITAGAPAYVLHSNQPGPGVGGYYLLSTNGALFAYDGSGSFKSSFASNAPVAQLAATVYSFPAGLLNAEAAPTLYAQLYQLNRQYDLQELNGSFYTNTYGHEAQWLYSPVANEYGQHWYTLTLSSDGTQAFLRAWQGYQDSATGAVLATLDPSVYHNPSLLTDATALPNPAVSASVNGSGKLLIALPGTNQYTGTFKVIVTASDGFLSTSTTALFDATDAAPTLTVQGGGGTIAPGGTQTVDHSSFPLSDAVATSDAEGDTVTTSATVTSFSLPFSLQQQYRFTGLGYFTGDASAYVLQSANNNSFGNPFYLLSTSGTLYAYDGSGSYSHTFANVTPIATLGANYYSDPNLLLNARPPVDYATLYNLQQQYQFTAVGTITAGATAYVLHSNQTGPGVGGYYLLAPSGALYAYDGSGSFAHTFANSTPIASLDPSVYTTPTILLGAEAAPGLYVQLYQSEQQFDLQEQGGSFYTGLMGQAAKWLYSPIANADGQHWYTLVLSSDGTQALLYAYDGGTSSIPSGAQPVATFDPSVYADPTLLTNARTPLAAVGATASVSGGTLTVSAPASFVGSLQVTVTATDGLKPTTQTFFVTSTAATPVIAAIGPQNASQSGAPTQVSLSATDADAVTFSATVTGYSPAYNLQQVYHFTGVGLVTTNGVSAYVMKSSVLGGVGGYYLLSSTGGVYAYDGSGNFATTFANSANLITTLDPSVYTTPALLTNAQPPAVPPAALSVTGNTLTVNVSAVSVGTVFEVFVTASDGAETTRTGFLVTVTP